MTVVFLPLQGRLAKKKDFTEDDYESLVNELLSPADVIYTFLFRYVRLLQTDMYTRFGEERSTQGFSMDFTNNNPWAAAIATAFVICASFVSLVEAYNKQQEKEQKELDEINNSYSTICDQLQLQRKKRLMGIPDPKATELNEYLTQILNEREDLRKKYNNVSVQENDNSLQLVFDKKDKEETRFEKSVSRFFGPVWGSLGIMTFTYWILYIGSGIFGGFGEFGVSNLLGFGFGISIASGLVYLGIAAYNHYQKEQNKALGIPEIADPESARDGIELLNECQFRRDYDLTKKQLETNLGVTLPKQKNHEAYQALIPKKVPRKAPGTLGLTWITALVGSYIGLQYIAWLIVDITFKAAGVILPGIELVNFLGGIGLFLIAGGYSAFKTHKANEAQSNQIIDINPEPPKKLYNDRIALISELKRGLIGKTLNGHVIDEKELQIASSSPITIPEQFRPPVLNPNKEMAKRVLKAFYTFIKSFMTGAMLARCLLVKGNAILLPFAAAAFSNPATIGLIVAISVVYGAINVYKEYLKIKEDEEKALQKQEEKQNTEYVRGIEIADLQISALKELQKQVTQDVIATPERTEKEVGEKELTKGFTTTPTIDITENDKQPRTLLCA